MKRKIRDALVQYTVEKDGQTSYEIAFRNQIVDIPDDQVERLDSLNATVAPDEDLERPGTLMELHDAASNSEITNWVVGATNAEVEALVRARPAMAVRIEAAHASVAERFSEQNLHLGGLLEIADEAQQQADAARAEQDAEDAKVIAELEAEAADLIGGGLSPEQADAIVAGNVKGVTDHIAENPRDAGVLVEAESRRAEAAKEDVRVTIVKAAEAAAGFTQ